MTTLRGALIGCGFFAVNPMHARAQVPGAAITAICDRDPARLATVDQPFRIMARHADAETMPREVRPDCVDIGSRRSVA